MRVRPSISTMRLLARRLPRAGARARSSSAESEAEVERAPSQTAMVPPEESFFTDRRHLETKLTEESASQIPDPVVLFDSVYNALCENYNNGDDLVFPKEVLWLCGAPGSGKGTHAASIMRQRGITEPPIVMSDLLISNESKAAKDAGTLVADGYVLERLLHEMIDPRYQNGVLIDGFPRNLLQAEMVRLMHAKMKSLRATHGRHFRRPSFRVAVLWVPEAVSVQRQLMRGQEARRENAERIKQGLPPLTDVERATDFDEGKARARYRTFKENYAVIKELQRTFHFSVIDGTPAKDVVAEALRNEFEYQSSLELGTDTYNIIDQVPTVSSISAHARQLLVKRLDSYAELKPELLREAVEMIETKLMPCIQRASISGRAAIRVNSERLLEEPILIDMVLDVLSDRGFHGYVEPITKYRPTLVDQKTGKILYETVSIHRFFVEFPKSIIRSSHRVLTQRVPDTVNLEATVENDLSSQNKQ